MARIKSIRSDPRWHKIVRKYRYDWIGAAVYLCGFKPKIHQRELLLSTMVTGARVTCSSGHGTGKSSSIAIVVLIFMVMFPNARVVLVANKLDQVKIAVWKNLKIYAEDMFNLHPWMRQYWVLTDTRFFERSAKGVWEVSAKSCQAGREEALAGEHAKNLLLICDESSGITDAAFGALGGALTEENNRLVLLSQPTRDNGYFWRTHNDPELMRRFTRLVFNSEDSPLVTSTFIMEKFIQYGGSRESVEYMIKVRGLFPKNLSGYLLGSADILKATKAKPKLAKDWGWVMTCDVGNGRDSSVINIARVSGEGKERRVVHEKIIEYKGNIDPVNFGRKIVNILNSGDYPNIVVAIDADGVGTSTCEIVEEQGFSVHRIHWGLKPFSDTDKRLYQDMRAKCSIECRDAIRAGRVRIDTHASTRDQGSKIPFLIDHLGRYVIEKKKIMRTKLNLPSPDRFDTWCFMFLVTVIPQNSTVDHHTLEDRRDAGQWAEDITMAS